MQSLEVFRKKMDMICVDEVMIYTGIRLLYKGEVRTDYNENNTDKVIEIPEGVTSIRQDVFGYRLIRVEKVILPNTVIELGNDCFNGSMLEEIEIPDSVERIGDDAFGDSSLRVIKFGENSKLRKIGCMAFKRINKQEIVEIMEMPKSYTAVGLEVFAYSKIHTVRLLADKVYIHTLAFDNSLVQKVEAKVIEVVEESAFVNCNDLESIDLSMTERIASKAFFNCKRLGIIDLRNCKVIDNNAFCGAHIKKLIMGTDSGVMFGTEVFEDCVIDELICGKYNYHQITRSSSCKIRKWYNPVKKHWFNMRGKGR